MLRMISPKSLNDANRCGYRLSSVIWILQINAVCNPWPSMISLIAGVTRWYNQSQTSPWSRSTTALRASRVPASSVKCTRSRRSESVDSSFHLTGPSSSIRSASSSALSTSPASNAAPSSVGRAHSSLPFSLSERSICSTTRAPIKRARSRCPTIGRGPAAGWANCCLDNNRYRKLPILMETSDHPTSLF